MRDESDDNKFYHKEYEEICDYHKQPKTGGKIISLNLKDINMQCICIFYFQGRRPRQQVLQDIAAQGFLHLEGLSIFSTLGGVEFLKEFLGDLKATQRVDKLINFGKI